MKKRATILQVIQDGFKIEDRLLRPALVGVSKKNLNSLYFKPNK
jgi:molecular chaperone GrpE (heat shock protein)